MASATSIHHPKHYAWGDSQDVWVRVSRSLDDDPLSENRQVSFLSPFDGFRAEREAAKARTSGAITVIFIGEHRRFEKSARRAV